MSDQPHPADRARADRLAELMRQREHVAFLAYRHAKEAEHHLERFEVERDTAETKRQRVRVIDEEIRHLEHPASGVHLVNEHYVSIDEATLADLLARIASTRGGETP